MKEFPNMVFEIGSFDSIYFFNTLNTGFSSTFYLELVKSMAPFGKLIVKEPKLVDDYEKIVLKNDSVLFNMTVLNDDESIMTFVENSNWHVTKCLLRLELCDVQIYSDPHDWDVCIIATRGKYRDDVQRILVEAGYFDKRMTQIEEFSNIWRDIANPRFFQYVIQNLRTEYAPFLQ